MTSSAASEAAAPRRAGPRRSARFTTVLHAPYDAPGPKALAGKRGASVLGGEDHAARRAARQRRCGRGEIGAEAQHLLARRPVHGEGPGGSGPGAAPRAQLRNQRRDLAPPDRQQLPVVFQRLRVRGLIEAPPVERSEEHTSELQSQSNLVCRLLLEKKNKNKNRALLQKKKKKNQNNK